MMTIERRHEQLSDQIQHVVREQEARIEMFSAVESFLNAATTEAAFGDSFAFFGRMRQAGKSIPKEFEDLDPGGPLKEEDRRIIPFIRSQQFVAMVANLENFLSTVLSLVLRAYPEKVGGESLSILELLKANNIENAIENIIEKKLNALFYASPKEYRKTVENYLSMPTSVLEKHWPLYIEMKARRDVGVHANWANNSRYIAKASEAGGPIESGSFLGINKGYFERSKNVSQHIVKAIGEHCMSKFGKPKQ